MSLRLRPLDTKLANKSLAGATYREGSAELECNTGVLSESHIDSYGLMWPYNIASKCTVFHIALQPFAKWFSNVFNASGSPRPGPPSFIPCGMQCILSSQGLQEDMFKKPLTIEPEMGGVTRPEMRNPLLG